MTKPINDRKLTKEEMEFADKFLQEVAEFVFSKSQENIITMGAVDTGQLLRSCNGVEKTDSGYKIHYDAPYAASVEYGRNPGSFPPVEALTKWVLRKKMATTEEKARSIAWAIANKIQEKGINPRPYIRNALKQAEVRYAGSVKQV